MSPRKSCRRRTVTSKVSDQLKTNNPVQKRKLASDLDVAPVKRLKSEFVPLKDDKIDPVERLLSQTQDHDILYNLDESDSIAYAAQPSSAFQQHQPSAYPNLSLNFTKIINENLRSYYSNFRKTPIEIHNDNSSFSILNKKPQQQAECQSYKMPEVPFFRNVNFNPKPSFGTIDDYLFYEDEDEISSPTDSEHEELPSGPLVVLPPTGKMSFHYRQNDNLNLSLSDCKTEEPQDIFKILNKRSVLTGKASEMIGASNFLINDFFL